jgi:hypothetical protein
VTRDALIKEGVKALHQCLEAEKELDVRNTVVGVVGAGTPFTILEGEALAPFLLGLGAAAPAGALPEVEEEDGAGGAGDGGEAAAAAGGGGGGGEPGMEL